MQSINIPSGVTSIGKHAFYDCESLQSINIPSGVTSIGPRAFENCNSLQSITFHSIPNVEEDAFYGLGIKNKNLDLTDSNKPYIGTSLANYPGGFTEANYHLTLAKDSWGTVVLPFVPSSESISNLEFYSYEGVDDGKVFVSEATDIQAGVPYLVKNVSEDETTSFTLTATNPTIILTAGSTSADGFTFKGCFRSSDIAANSNLYYLDGTAFQKATQDNLAPLHTYIVAPEIFEKKSMDVEIWNPGTVPVFVDGVIPTATTTGKYGYWLDESQNKYWNKFCTKPITDDSELTVPVAKDNEIWYTSIDNNLIENKVNSKTNEYQYGLGKIVLADGVIEIADNAFNRNKTIQSIFIPSAVKKIGNSSFWECINLNSVFISEGVTFIDQYAFGKTPIQSILIPSTVQTIATGVFNECTQLQSIVFHSLPKVEYGFLNCNISTKVLDLKDGEKPYINTSLDNYPSGGFTEAKYALTLAKDSWGTVVLPFVPSSESTSNLEFYSYEGVDDGKVFVSETTDIQAGVPYLVKNVSEDETTSFTLTATNPTITLTAGSTSTDGFTFKGCFRSSDVATNSNFYYMNGTAFQKATQDNVAPLHAYIEAPETFEEESMGVKIAPVFVDGVVPTATTTGRYGYWLDESQNKKYWNKFCTKPITDDSELTVPVAKDNEIWYTTTDGNKCDPFKSDGFGATIKSNKYENGLGVIEFDETVTSIGEYAFRGCKSLQSISIPSGVTSIGAYAFSDCTSLQSISIPSDSKVTSIGEWAFAWSQLQSISIPSGVTSIGKRAFESCKSLQSINIPSDSKLTSIGEGAFYGCNLLQSINIPSGVTSIGKRAFGDCESLQSITFHSIPNVEEDAFLLWAEYFIKNKTLDLTDSNKPYIGTSLNNYPSGGFTEAKYALTLAKDSWGTVVLPFVPSSESISNLEFYSYEGVDDGKVYVSKATDIQAGVPYLVKNVSEDETTSFTLTATNPTITLTAGSRNADGFTFKGCFRSSNIAANSNLYYLDGTAFQKATQDNLAPLHAYIEAPETFGEESMDVVIWNSEITSEFVDGVIPTATTTGKYGYWLDKSQNKKYWTKFCVRPITDDNELTVQVAKDNEIWYTTTDNKLIENGVNFKTNEYQYGLGKIVLADGVTEIADNAFKEKTTLMSVYIPSSVKKIGKGSFSGCTFLQSVLLSSGLEVIDDNAFDACTGLTSITIPGTVTRIGKSVFVVSGSENTSLKTVTIPENSQLEIIDDDAFNRCRALQSIRIPSSVKKIGNSSFWGCTALESVIFSSLPDVDQHAFGECGKLTTKTLDLTDSDKPYIGTSLENYPSGGFTEARFSISLEKDSWETVVLPFVPTNTDGLKFYSCSKVNGMMLEVKETAEIRAGVPYLVKNTSDSKTNFTLTATDQISIVLNTSDPESVNGFTLKGTFQTKDLNKDDSKKYYYWNGVGFYQVTAQQTVNPIHAYIETSDMSAVDFIIPTEQEGQVYGVLAIDNDYVLLKGSADSYYLDKVELKYGHSYFCTDDFKATNSSYKLRVNPGKWNSWFVPFAVTTGTLEANNLTAAYIAGVRQYEKDAEGNITTLVDIIKIKNARLRAGTPYLVKYDGEDLGDGDVLTLDLGETDFAASSDVHPLNSATTTASYDFIGCYEKAEFDISDKDLYYFMGSNGSLVHSKDNSFSALDWYLKVTPKGDVYDDLSTPSLAKSIIINVIGEEDETTGIRTLYPAEKQVKEVYDLTGRKLSAPKSGQVNIVGGKKLFINQ